MPTNPSPMACVRCKRICGETINPAIKDPKPTDCLKRRGQRNFCQNCHAYCASHAPYEGLDSKGVLAKIEEDQEAYDAELAEWEAGRRQGKRCRTGEKNVTVAAETRSSITTRVLLGYVWSLGLLKRHKLESLWPKHSKTTVIHCGKPITGILRDVGGPGAVEIYSDSQTSAVRKHHKADTSIDDEEDTDKSFRDLTKHLTVGVTANPDAENGEPALQLKSKRARFDEEDEDFLSVWGIAGVVSSGAKGSRDSDDEDDQVQPKPKKRGKGGGGSANASSAKPRKAKFGANQAPATPAADDAASQPDTNRDFGLSSDWMFGAKLRGPKGKGSGKGNKELDNTEKVLTLYDSYCKQLESEDTFMSLSFKKAGLVCLPVLVLVLVLVY